MRRLNTTYDVLPAQFDEQARLGSAREKLRTTDRVRSAKYPARSTQFLGPGTSYLERTMLTTGASDLPIGQTARSQIDPLQSIDFAQC